VVGTENDPVALEAARRGAELNRVSGVELRLAEDPDEIEGSFDLVVANILLNTLVELAPAIARRVAPGGTLLLSGLLAQQGGEAERAYLAQGLAPRERKEVHGWLRVELAASSR